MSRDGLMVVLVYAVKVDHYGAVNGLHYAVESYSQQCRMSYMLIRIDLTSMLPADLGYMIYIIYKNGIFNAVYKCSVYLV